MRSMVGAMVAAMLAAVPAVGSAQLLGGRVGVGAGVNVPPVGSTMGSTVDSATRTVDGAAGTVADTTRRAPSVTVRAGAATRVDRGTRCYWQPDDYYYDPIYRDGYYYCEPRQSSGVAAGASVATPR